jgi:hypothetical protein
MTLVIGIRCADGVIIGSDGAVTFGSMGHQTIQQPSSKLQPLSGEMILGFSGPRGLGQRIGTEIEQVYRVGTFNGATPVGIGSILRKVLWENVLKLEYEVARSLPSQMESDGLQHAVCSLLLALPVGNQAELVTFDELATPEVATADLPFVSIGSGQDIADPFLAFLRRVFFPDHTPTVAEGTLCVLWTLLHATACHPGGVALPIAMYKLSLQGDRWKATLLDQKDLAEHKQAINNAETSLRGILRQSSAPPRVPETGDLPDSSAELQIAEPTPK